MQTVTMVICNSGDGSNHIEWFKGSISREDQDRLVNYDPERYSSGDGFQEREFSFPDGFDFEAMGIKEYEFTSVDTILDETEDDCYTD